MYASKFKGRYDLYPKHVIGYKDFISGKENNITGIEIKGERYVTIHFDKFDPYFDTILLQPLVHSFDNPWIGCGSFIFDEIAQDSIKFHLNKEFHLGEPRFSYFDIVAFPSEQKYENIIQEKADYFQIELSEIGSILNDEVLKRYDLYKLPSLTTIVERINLLKYPNIIERKKLLKKVTEAFYNGWKLFRFV